MQGVHELDGKIYVSNDKNIVKKPYKSGNVGYFQLNKKAMMFDFFVVNNDKIIEKYTFHPNEKRMKNLDNMVKLICEKIKPLLKDENIKSLIDQINKKAIF